MKKSRARIVFTGAGKGNELVSVTNQLKLVAPDGKKRLTDTLDDKGVIALAQNFPSARAMRFIGEETIDGRSRSKAYFALV